MLRAIGLMSGTSLDGVDAAWLETDGERIGRFGPAVTLPYSQRLRADLRRVLDLAPHLAPDDPFLLDVTTRLTLRHAEAVAAVGQPADIVGFPGQTILHRPVDRRTWQIGDAAALAGAVRVQVAFDFRSADVAAGGEGAPLAPVFHSALAEGLEKPLAVLNIGGVANITWVGPDAGLLACDTGPGNGPLDDWMSSRTGDAFDRDGRAAAAGRVDHSIVRELLAHPYFSRAMPKSLDRLEFSQTLATSGLGQLSVEDGAATLTAILAEAVRCTLLSALHAPPRRVLVSGGGRGNPAVMAALKERLPMPVQPVEAVGWNGDALEAQCFAFLAVRVLRGLPLSFPGTTGAPFPLSGGRIVVSG
jgi:anhydro-N-acetylmuramic acid kinase